MRRPERVWRECAWCGARTRRVTCGQRCNHMHFRLRAAERGQPTSSGARAQSEWEAAEREARVRLAARLWRAGCPLEVALDEAGFTADEWEAAERAVFRFLKSHPHSAQEANP